MLLLECSSDQSNSPETWFGVLAILHHGGKAKTSANRKLSAIKSFVGWLRSDGIILDDNFDKIATIKRPKSPSVLPDVPSQEQMSILLDGDFPTAFPQRDRLLLELLYGSGLRVSEAAQIKLQDLRPEQNAILIHGKGGPYGKSAKFRLVPLNARSRAALDVYLVEREKSVIKRKLETDVLFFPCRPLFSRKARIAQRPQRSSHAASYSQIAGLSPMHPHLLRHACATHMLDNGCPLDVIGTILGHQDLDITAHYARYPRD